MTPADLPAVLGLWRACAGVGLGPGDSVLAVAAGVGRRGIGTALVAAVERGLAAVGIAKCHLFVKAANPDAVAFWGRLGWVERTDLRMFSRELG
jgi:hypothetical protein